MDELLYQKKDYGHIFVKKIEEMAIALVIQTENNNWYGKFIHSDNMIEELTIEENNVIGEYGTNKIAGKSLKEYLYTIVSEILNHEKYRMILTVSDVPNFIRKDLFHIKADEKKNI